MAPLSIPAHKLAKFDNDEKTNFMVKVYELHVKSAQRRNHFVDEIPESELAVIEGSHKAKRNVALLCRDLLSAAREDLAEQQKSPGHQATLVKSIGIASAYRSARRQFRNWRKNFSRYYTKTADERAKLRGGEHGDARPSPKYIAVRLAAPGFSLHNSGIAIDFATTDHGHQLGPSKSLSRLWKKSWFYKWLVANAGNYGFRLNPNIDEPWHWEMRSQVDFVNFTAEEESAAAECVMEDGNDFPVGRGMAQVMRATPRSSTGS